MFTKVKIFIFCFVNFNEDFFKVLDIIGVGMSLWLDQSLRF